jgi:hypothetical protein
MSNPTWLEIRNVSGTLRESSPSILDDIETHNGRRSDLATLEFSKKIGFQLAQSTALHLLRVRFQKEMRLVSLEIPEPNATGYQNLCDKNPKLTRSRATKFRRRLKCGRISRKAAPPSARSTTGAEIGAGKVRL